MDKTILTTTFFLKLGDFTTTEICRLYGGYEKGLLMVKLISLIGIYPAYIINMVTMLSYVYLAEYTVKMIFRNNIQVIKPIKFYSIMLPIIVTNLIVIFNNIIVSFILIRGNL